MTLVVPPNPGAPVPVQVIAAGTATQTAMAAGLHRQPGIAVTGAPAARVAVVVAATISDALQLLRQAHRSADERLIIVTGLLTPGEVFTAVRAGVCAILPRATANPDSVAAAVHAVASGDGTMPRQTRARLLEQAAEPEAHPAEGTVTERELPVLRLVADGYGNAEIARRLNLSEHTVKNVIYEMMMRLRLRNRTHAAAFAVRSGLV